MGLVSIFSYQKSCLLCHTILSICVLGNALWLYDRTLAFKFLLFGMVMVTSTLILISFFVEIVFGGKGA